MTDLKDVIEIKPLGVYTIPQAAQLLQVDPRTVKNFIKENKIETLPHQNTVRILGGAILSVIPGSASYNLQPQQRPKSEAGVPVQPK